MRIIKVDDEGQIFDSGILISKEKFTADFLIGIFTDKMNNQVEFELSDKSSVSQIFKGIQDALKDDSTFKKQYDAAKANAEKYKKELDNLMNPPENSDKLD